MREKKFSQRRKVSAKYAKNSMNENELSKVIFETSLELHKALGPGLLETVYENSLAFDLRKKGLEVDQQVPMPLIYKDVNLEVGYRLDIVVNRKVVLEIKSVETLAPVHYAQLLTYLKLSGLKLGL